jgi:N-acetyl-anhydromuramyl-L-alanine amidase AmpD
MEYLWWIDHFTAGISQWSTLNWFSAEKRQKKNGTIGYAGACTHFVQGYHDEPFYIIPLMHGSWNEPRRNKDSISIEHVNAGALHRDPQDNNWHYWANPMPIKLVQELPPVLLDTPYRGVKVMQPFTKTQLLNNIKLKRVVVTALGKLDPCRMSQHSDWRQGKTDMGVLWPFEECNKAAFIRDPLHELDFIQSYEDFMDAVGTIWDEKEGWDKHNEADNPEYGELTPTHDDDPDNDPDEVLETTEIQQLLVNKGYNIVIDGIPGPKTRETIKQFQQDWNKKNPRGRIKVDGIPGPQTCGCLKGKKNASQD